VLKHTTTQYTLLIQTTSYCGLWTNTRETINITNNTFTNNSNWGIWIDGQNNSTATLQNNTLENNGNGIYIQNIHGLTLNDTNNNIHDNGGTTYQLQNADNTTIENTSFNNSVKAYNYAVYAADSDNLILRDLNINNNNLQAIWIGGTSVNTTINNVNITNSTQQAIWMQNSLTNVTINNTKITDTKSNAIQKEYWTSGLYGITITNTQIINPTSHGIILDGNNWGPVNNIIIDNTTVTQADSHGIYILMGNTNSQNLQITNTTSTNNGDCGLWTNTRETINITNNTFTNNSNWGIWIDGQNNSTIALNNNNLTNNGNGLYLQSINGGVFQDNQLINNTGDDLSANANTNNAFVRLTMGVAHPTTVSFNYLNGIIMNGVENAPVDPSGLVSIGKYVDIMGLGSTTVNLTVHYNATDVAGKNETGLRMFHYGNSWSQLPQPNGVNTTDKYVYAEGINSFSTFAPLTVKLSTSLNVPDVTGYRNGVVDLTATLTSEGIPVVGKTVTFTIDGTTVGSADTAFNGVATLPYTLDTMVVGTYTLGAEFVGDANYYGSTGSANLYVYKNNASMVVSDISGINGNLVQLQATLINETTETPLSGKTVYFTVNGVSMGSSVTDSSGLAILDYTVMLTPGIYTINATFSGDEDYNTTESIGTLTVYKNNTSIVVDDVNGLNGQDVNLQSTLTNQDGTPLNGKTIVFTINGTAIGSAITGTNGIATLNYPITVPPGTYTINATFNGDTNYNSTYNTATLTIHKNNTNIVVTDVSGNFGQNLNLQATLTNQATGTPLPGKNVDFAVNGALVGSAVTDSNGIGTLNYLITLSPSTYTINATFNGDGDYNGTYSVGTLTVYKNSTHIEVANVAGINGSPVELQATLTDQGNGNPIPGQTIDFTVNSVSVGSAVTDSSGVARLSYPIILAPGIYTVNATYAGNSVYNATHGTGLLTVYKNSTNILVINVEGINGQNVNLQATLTNQDGTPLNGKTIVFTINGTAIGSAITGTNGTATLNYPITVPPGTYTINTTFNGDGDYKTSNSTGILTVNKKIATMVVSNVNGTNGTVVDLNATLTDSDGNPFAGQTLYFRVDSNLVGSANTNGNGVASLAYLINPISGMHTIQIDFQGNADYQATTGYGNLRVPQSSLYIRTTASKTNPTLGETITITFKLGNNGPDTAENVIFTLVIPEGMEFINASTDQGSWTYNDTTRTITWNLGNVTVGDPNLWAIVRVLNNGNYVLMPFLSTDTYDPNLNSNIQPITISVQAASQEFEAVVNAGTVGMQNTGVPIGLLVMAVLMTLGGILVPKRKK